MRLPKTARVATGVMALVTALVLAACGDDDGPIPQTGVRETTTTTSTTTSTTTTAEDAAP